MTGAKPALRARLRADRDRFAAEASATLRPGPAYLARLVPGVVVASYRPVGGEIDPAPLEEAALAAGGAIVLPHVVDRDTPLRFLAADAGLEDGPYGLRHPPADAAEHVPDIILAPLVGFDRRLNRLGQGGGHYDRAFAASPMAWRIGLAWSVQEVAAVPTDAWDLPLHAIATEREWIVA